MGEIKTKKDKCYIRYEFSEDELKDMAGELAEAHARNEALEQKLKEVRTQIKAEIEAEKTKISTLSRHYSQGHCYKHADCIVEFDFAAHEVRTYREDTGALVEKRTIRNDELQQEMFDENKITAPVDDDSEDILLEEEEVEESETV